MNEDFNSSRQRSSEGMPIISIGDSFNNRHRQSIQDNFGIQLPLIETHQPRVNYFLMFYISHILFYLFSQYQEIRRQEKQQNHLVFYLSNVDEILL